MTHSTYEVRQGAYYDSVILMQLQKGLAALPGIQDAGVVMATPANRELLTASGFALDGIDAQSDDLLIVLRGESETAVNDALSQINTLLQKRQSGGTASYRPKGLDTATKMMPNAHWVLISVPGRYASAVAEQALDLGKHVFLYSDNVPLEKEVLLKKKGQTMGRLVMGPDCGTAVINGAGFGFANRVRRGNIGVIAASGTGMQAVISAIHQLGGGISQAIGTGGRDLKAEVGGSTMLQALDLLMHDPSTDRIVLISKPPEREVAAKLLRRAASGRKPVLVNFIGYAPPAAQLNNLHFVVGLQETAAAAVALETTTNDPKHSAPLLFQGDIRGLFSGGTLALETYYGLRPFLPMLKSNISIDPAQQPGDVWHSSGHTLLDLGEDAFTQGRLHPMMDNDLRGRRLRQELKDPKTGLVILDIVLGDGAHPDPASELAPIIEEAKSSAQVAAVVVGTDQDPQEIEKQSERMAQAGAVVFRSTRQLLEALVAALPQEHQFDASAVPLAHFSGDMAAINVGLESFFDQLDAQGVAAVHVDWRPPAGGNEKMMALLAKMKSK